jgi:predicted O-methyltransferase YrrM
MPPGAFCARSGEARAYGIELVKETGKMDIVDPRIERYAEEHTSDVSSLLDRLERETRKRTRSPQMLSGRTEGHFLALLLRMIGARRVLEIGMFTGYSALMMASALPDDGELVTLDVDPEAESIAKRYFAESPHGRKIRVEMGPALETLASVEGPFDFAFVDADKKNYPLYYDRVLELLRPGGVVAVDNVLWSGEVLDPKDEEAEAIHALNERVHGDPRVDHVLLTVRDGILLARKK